MAEDGTETLKNFLWRLLTSHNTVLDRLDNLTDKIQELSWEHDRLISQNKEAFKFVREDFFRRLIEAEVNKGAKKNKQTAKNKQHNERRANFGSDVIRKPKKT